VSATLFQPQDTVSLKETLLKNLPAHTKAFSSKDEFSTIHDYQPTEQIIDTARFIRYNTKKFTNFLIFDIDAFPSFDFKPSLTAMHDHFYNLTGFEPSWTLETEKGFHIGLVLNKGIFNTWKDGKTPTAQYHALINLKKSISSLIDADHNASNRSYGIWRNPLTHKHIFTGKVYNFEELLEEFDIPLQKPKPKLRTGQLISNQANLTMRKDGDNKILAALEKGFYVGNRNNYLFAYGYKKLFENKSLEASLEQLILAENNRYNDPLTNKEVSDITSSILKLLPTMYSSNTMKRRGKLSNLMWKLNIHGTSQRRAFAGWHTAKERHNKTLEKITKTLLDTFEKGKTPTPSYIAKEIGTSEKTVKRYNRKYNLKALVFSLWHQKILKRANSEKPPHKIDIRPFVQTEVMAKLKRVFSSFSVSEQIKLLDMERKKLYLASLYPLSA